MLKNAAHSAAAPLCMDASANCGRQWEVRTVRTQVACSSTRAPSQGAAATKARKGWLAGQAHLKDTIHESSLWHDVYIPSIVSPITSGSFLRPSVIKWPDSSFENQSRYPNVFFL